MNRKIKLHLLVLLTVLSLPILARAQGTAFSYQGRLVENDAPVSGLYDFIFTVHDAETNGNALGGPLPLNGITVSAGLFAAPLDFGEAAFTGAPRWLEIGVRVNGTGAHTPLVPRQALLPTPYAIHAGSAGTVPEGTVVANQLNTGGVAPAPGQFLSYDGGNLVWNDPGVAAGNIWSLSGNNAFYNTGNVGIGTTTPASKLEIAAQDGLRIAGFQPFMTFADGNAANARSRIQGVGGDINLLTESYLRGANPFSFLKLANNGNVGIGSATPVAKLEVVGQDALRLIGYQPFLTLSDANAGYASGRIQSANGGIILEPESYIDGSNPGAAVVLANSGFVGIGTIDPVAKLHAETPLANTAAVYGKATGSGGVGVYGQSAGGTAVHAEGNATQARDKGGFVKAMAYIDPFLPADQYVVRCYNSQQAGNAASTSPCGIQVFRSASAVYTIDFGFNVEDRFISVTPRGPWGGELGLVAGIIRNVSGNRVEIAFSYIDEPSDITDSKFYIIVY